MEARQLHDLAVRLQRDAGGQPGSAPRPEIHVADQPLEAWAAAQRLAGPDDVICITGSFFLAAELRPVVSLSRVEAIDRPAPSVA
jgi:hypothetical protein